MKLSNTILKGLMIAGLLTGGSLIAMQRGTTQEKPVQLIRGGAKWYNEALQDGISSPLKVRIVNNTRDAVKTVQQGQGNIWWTRIAKNGTFEDAKFNLDRFTSQYPQYTILTADNVYTLNFKKNGIYTAILERLDIEPGLAKGKSDQELLNMANLINKLPVAEVERIIPGQVLNISVDGNFAALGLSKE